MLFQSGLSEKKLTQNSLMDLEHAPDIHSNISNLMDDYHPGSYDYHTLSTPFRELDDLEGFDHPSKEGRESSYQLYFRAIQGIFGILLAFTLFHLAPIYYFAITEYLKQSDY